MPPRNKITTLSSRMVTLVKNYGSVSTSCRQCNKELVVGEKIVTKLTCKGKRSRVKWYHFECAERLHIV